MVRLIDCFANPHHHMAFKTTCSGSVVANHCTRWSISSCNTALFADINLEVQPQCRVVLLLGDLKAVPRTKIFREEVYFFGKSVQIGAQITNSTSKKLYSRISALLPKKPFGTAFWVGLTWILGDQRSALLCLG